MIELKK